MTRSLTILTGSRLHFGPLAWKPERGRDFGGWGVMLETPRTVVRVGESGAIPEPAGNPSRLQARARSILQQLSTASRDPTLPMLTAEVLDEPPAHCGFGSGTQLALAIGTALARLQDAARPSPADLAIATGRGLRSAVGVYGFELGGLIVDAGKLPGDALGQLAAHAPLPDEWRFVLVRPNAAVGLAGDREATAFRELPPFSPSLTERLTRIVFDGVVPAVRGRRFDEFSAALDEYGILVGEAFRDCQGGVVHPAARPIWTALRERGLRGIAQTSWGPTLAIVCRSPEAAAHTAELIQPLAPQSIVQTAQPRNRGAEIITD